MAKNKGYHSVWDYVLHLNTGPGSVQIINDIEKADKIFKFVFTAGASHEIISHFSRPADMYGFAAVLGVVSENGKNCTLS